MGVGGGRGGFYKAELYERKESEKNGKIKSIKKIKPIKWTNPVQVTVNEDTLKWYAYSFHAIHIYTPATTIYIYVPHSVF